MVVCTTMYVYCLVLVVYYLALVLVLVLAQSTEEPILAQLQYQ